MLVFNMRLTAQQKKNLYYLVPLIVLLISTLLFYFLAIRVKPNDKILTNSEGVALFANENPTFEVQFGDKENPDGQWIRFEARTSNDNPFSSEEKKNIFTKIASIFASKNKSGIEMSLRGVDFSETKSNGKAQQDEEIQKVADILGTEEIKTSTVLTEMGREIGENEGDQIISKQTIVNQGVADGIDLEYQILKGLGLKEEIVINDLEAYRNSCDEGCKLPLNEFVFDLKVDDGVVLKKGWFTVDGKSSEVYYFVDGHGKYLAHFLPSYAVDDAGDKTYEVDLKIEEVKTGNYEAKVTVNSDWLLNENRVYPIRIDPSIVHDDSTDFSGGVFDRVGSLTGPKISLDECTGGVISYSEGYKIHTFTASDSFYCAKDKNVEVLVVAGGGGGGGRHAGGGGGGGVRTSSNLAILTGNYDVTVGAGGTAGPYGGKGGNGGDSIFSTITSTGGGGGGGYTGVAGTVNGAAGGSGGGAAGATSLPGGNGVAGTGNTPSTTPPQGYNGGASGATNYDGGGGGGAGVAGSAANGVLGGAGGNGILSTITGVATYYGGGGGGAGDSNVDGNGGAGGLGGGGRGTGAYYPVQGVAGTANTGGGGGGSRDQAGAAGGSGIVIVRYKSSPFGTYTSSSLNLGSAVPGMTMSWLASGVNTGNGETPYSTSGMVAQWNFNETSGITAVSGGTCGTSCNGTLTNMTTTGQDAAVGTGWTANNRRWGAGAVMFDGSNDFINIGNNFNYGASDAFTFESWVMPGSVSTMQAVLDKRGDSVTWYRLGIDANGLVFIELANSYPTNYKAISSTKKYNDNQWHFLVVTRDSSGNLVLYVDGIQIGTATGANFAITNSYNLSIGKSVLSANAQFNGIIDSTRIYSRALSANEILSNYQSGNIEFQYRTSTNNSTWSNWTSYNDGALVFDGNDDHIVVDDVALIDSLTSFSTCAWVNNDTMTTDSMIWSKVDNSTWSGIMFVKDIVGQVSGRTNMYKIWAGQNSAAAFIEGATNSATTGAWQHVCATYTANSATGLRLYVNGVEDANSPVSTVGITSIDAGTSILNIGKYNPGTTSYMDGSIDNIQIYDRVLAGSEITSNYNVPDFETPYSSTGLLAHWKFNELSDTTAISGGICGIACNGTLTNFSSTTARDSSTTSGWTAETKLGSDYPEYSFDNPYLYKTDDTGLVAYWPMEEVSGTGAYIKDVSTPFAVGGTITYSGGYTIHTFKSSDTFTVNGSGKVEVLVVAGGGGGGTAAATGGGGGGGAGGVLYSSSVSVSAGSNSVTVGSGGGVNANGVNSSILSLTAIGGGYGGNATNGTGNTGGSGGGSRSGVTSRSSGTSGQGYAGGIGNASINYGAGGGGGASAQGYDGTTGGGSNGGAGISNSITGTSVYYGGGGGGSFGQFGNPTMPNGGVGGGGAGGFSTSPLGVAGTANTGGGGGGGWNGSAGAAGGSGVVIVRYPSSYTATTTDTVGDATPTGTAYVNGKSGGARSFNGSSDKLSVGTMGSFGAQIGTSTVEAWVKTTDTSTNKAIVKIIDNSGYASDVVYGIEPNRYFSSACTQAVGAGYTMFFIRDRTGLQFGRHINTNIYDGNWHHIAWVVTNASSNSMAVYVDGVAQTLNGACSQSPATFNNWTQPLYIGAANNRGTAEGFFNGSIDEVRIFNTALSASTISSDYTQGIMNKSNTISQSGSNFKMEGTGSTKLTSGAYVFDSSTVGLWHLDERGGTGAYIKDSSPATELPFATGGTVTYSGGYTIHTFTSTGSFVANASGNVDVLVVGGGGGGGGSNGAGGGGGAGGVTYSTGVSVAESTYTATVGTGGNGSAPTGGSGVSGTGSSLGSLVTVSGGGGGGGYNGSSTTAPGSGGSGGGGGSSLSGTFTGASGTAGQGYAGGNGLSSGTLTDQAGGGGGGASQVGTASTGAYGGNGGNGVSNSITGSAVTYGGGGGGGKRSAEVAGTGGTGGGGNGGLGAVGSIGTNGLGGGGGGGANGYAGGNGGSGVVIIRYPSTQTGGTTGNHGTPTGTTYTNTGKIGGARSFNGTSDSVSVGTTSTLDFSSAFTAESWIYRSSTQNSTDSAIVAKISASPYNGYMLFYQSDNTVDLYINGAVRANSTYVIPANTWTNVVGVWTGSLAQIYINGVLSVSTAYGTAPTSSGQTFWIGRYSDSPRFFTGLIDEVRMSNTARTANEIAESYKLGKDSYINQTLNTIDLSTKNTMAINVASDRPGTYLSTTLGESAFANYQPDINTVGLWHIDEISGSGAYIKDVSGSGNNGTPTGTTYTSSGKLGGARSFNGSSDYINAGSNTALGPTTAITVSAWIKTTTTSVGHIVERHDEASYNRKGYLLLFNSDGTVCWSAGLDGTPTAYPVVCSSVKVNDDKFHHVAGVFSSNLLAIYVDGVLSGTSTSAPATIASPSKSLVIGRRDPQSGFGPDRYFNGTIDEVRIDNTARTADQIRQAYEVGLRTHNITVTFGAGLASGNLISNSSDYSFNIDATKYGLPSLGSELYPGDKIIIKENYNGTESIAQGTVSTVDLSTGAVVVSSWDSGSTFPSGGYTVNADVFKWQKEYIPVKNRTISNQVDATNLLTFRLNDGNEGRNIWIDDLRSSTGYLKNSSSEVISFPSSAQYVQYKTIFTSWDSNVTPYLSQVQVDYDSGGPTIDQLMRHGQWLDSSGAKQGFWWVGTH
ncbi:MAG: hypothetical protein UR96_C0006G0002 [candidate division WS6 bacterium GW2011_GWC1_36_11]|uniref:LamG-like jellyroll fold domain-containing protein n=3 Tax=Candidatus Dojkabacteria TaxID=74243 RepID=A0A0G0DUQ6_9BACT|nr:MAG: hypothetical protein UR96_C0006G0002 [candidate division WS6 bacterium GW2011_GWC1_36_11]KKQ17410.1 MAG: hypothetical protein US29_C0009G0002 [candidate division WS6 bacterium GW2011_GWF1_36_8]